MILARTPHKISIPWLYQSVTEPDYFDLEVYVWQGQKSSVPSEPEATIRKQNPLEEVGSTSIDVSPYIRPYLDVIPPISDTTGIIDGVSVWVKTQVVYTIGGVEQSAEQEVVDLAIDGYGYGNEGFNPTSDILVPKLESKASTSGLYFIPFLADEQDFIDIRLVTDNTDETFTQLSTTINMAKNFVINVDDYKNEEYVEVYRDGVLIYTILPTKERRYTPMDIVFVNKYGQLFCMPFFKDKTHTLEVEGDSYENGVADASIGEHVFVDYNLNGRDSFTAFTGYMKESNNEIVRQLMLSEKIWHLKDGVLIPLNRKSSSFEQKTRVRDKVINYEIEFEYSYNSINNI